MLKRIRADSGKIVVATALATAPVAYGLGIHLNWGSEPLRSSGWFLAPGQLPPGGAAASSSGAAASPQPAEAPAPAAQPDPEQAAWDAMVKRLEAEAIAYPGRVSVFLEDLKRDRAWSYRPDDLFPSASLIKVPIMAAVFEKIRRGEMTLLSRLVLRRRHRAGGAGSLKWYRDGTQFTVMQILEKMIDESDNTATRIMIEAVGLEYLQEQFPRMGLVYTGIYPEGLSLQSARVSHENHTTAREMAHLLQKIYRKEMVDPYASELMLDILKRQKSRARLAKGLPPGWRIAHKTGLLRGACHDAAIIFTPQGDYVLTVLTGQNRGYARAKRFITQMGSITYKYYRGSQPFYAKAPAGAQARHSRRSLTGILD